MYYPTDSACFMLCFPVLSVSCMRHYASICMPDGCRCRTEATARYMLDLLGMAKLSRLIQFQTRYVQVSARCFISVHSFLENRTWL